MSRCPFWTAEADQPVTGLVDVPGLEAVRAEVEGQQRVAVLLPDLVPGELPLSEDLVELRIGLDDVDGELREFAHRDLLLRMAVAGRIAERRLRQPELAGALGHHPGEVLLGAGNALGHDDRRVVAGLDDDAAQEIGQFDAAVELGEHRRAARTGAAAPPGVLGHRELRVDIDPALLHLVEHDLDRHDLGHAGRGGELVGVLLEQDGAAVGIDQDGVRGERLEALRKA